MLFSGLLIFLAPDTVQGAVHTVRKGETLWQISRRYRVSVEQLLDQNPALKSNGGKLRIGQKICVSRPSPVRARRAAIVSRGSGWQPSRSGQPMSPISGTASQTPARVRPVYLYLDTVKAQIDSAQVRPGRWKYIVLHHSGTSSGNGRIFEYFHRHMRGMENGMAYHFVIGNGKDSADGQIEVGNRWLKQLQGGHVRGEDLNRVAIGICFVGNFNNQRPTRRQIGAAMELISYLREKCGAAVSLQMHNEINPRHTECPGKYFPSAAFHQLFDRN